MSVDTSKNNSNSEASETDDTPPVDQKLAKEIGGRGGLDPTRYGDWEKRGAVSIFRIKSFHESLS